MISVSTSLAIKLYPHPKISCKGVLRSSCVPCETVNPLGRLREAIILRDADTNVQFLKNAGKNYIEFHFWNFSKRISLLLRSDKCSAVVIKCWTVEKTYPGWMMYMYNRKKNWFNHITFRKEKTKNDPTEFLWEKLYSRY